jgi:hypothetical protein
VKNTWIGYLHAFRLYIENLRSAITGDTPTAGSNSRLFDFGTGQRAASGHASNPLIECVCGSTVDANTLIDIADPQIDTPHKTALDALDRGGCRHCRGRILNIEIQCLDGIPDRFKTE